MPRRPLPPAEQKNCLKLAAADQKPQTADGCGAAAVNVAELRRIHEALCRLAAEVAALAGDLTAPGAPAAPRKPRTLAAVGAGYLRARYRRDARLASRLREPAWDILVELLVSSALGRRVSISDACLATVVPPTTALRHLGVLQDAGLIHRVTDIADGRRVYLELTVLGEDLTKRFLDDIALL